MPNDRRRFFRIEDYIFLQAQKVESSELESKLENFRSINHQFYVRNEFSHGLDEHLTDLHVIQNKMPEVARYLCVLQEQIDRLTEKISPEHQSTAEKHTRVNLSAQGISFITDEAFEPVDVVELKLKLQPSQKELIIFARVVLVEDHEDNDETHEYGKYRVSMDFEHIHEADRETLVKHVHAKQLQTLNKERNNGST